MIRLICLGTVCIYQLPVQKLTSNLPAPQLSTIRALVGGPIPHALNPALRQTYLRIDCRVPWQPPNHCPCPVLTGFLPESSTEYRRPLMWATCRNWPGHASPISSEHNIHPMTAKTCYWARLLNTLLVNLCLRLIHPIAFVRFSKQHRKPFRYLTKNQYRPAPGGPRLPTQGRYLGMNPTACTFHMTQYHS